MGNYIIDKPGEQIVTVLAALLDVPIDDLDYVENSGNNDLTVNFKDIKFIVEYKKYSSTIEITNGIKQLNKYKHMIQDSSDYNRVYLLVVPYMGEVGASLCKNNEISWIDLSGNAFIKKKNLYINVSGNENKFKSRGRPLSIFAPKSSRVARYILAHNGKKIFQKDIVKKTELSEGYVSRILKRLEKESLIKKIDRGYIEIKNKELILNTWRENYDFNKNEIIKGIMPAKSKKEVLDIIINKIREKNIDYALTGLAAAWLINNQVDYKITAIYVQKDVSGDLEGEGFLESERGANTWLIIPQDKGVFQEVKIKNNINYVHPAQLYLDLVNGYPERAKDAAKLIINELDFGVNNGA